MVARRFTPLTINWTPAVRVLLISAGVAGLAACATTHRASYAPPPPPPSPAMETHSTPVQAQSGFKSLPNGCTDEKCARRVLAAHRQYFDMRHKRYYYYDPARRAYFWEDGAPKS